MAHKRQVWVNQGSQYYYENFVFQVYGGSSSMEPAALEASLNFLLTMGLRISHAVTDRCSAIQTLMKEKFSWINHQADPWHFIKVS